MPKRAVAEISHSALTNHRIVATPNEPLPDEYYTRTTPGLPGLLYLDNSGDSGALPLLTRLSAYGELQAQAPELAPEYIRTFDQAQRTLPNEPLVAAAAGRKALIESRYDEAVQLLKRATEAEAPPSPWLLDLAQALTHIGRASDALDVLARAAQNDPYDTAIQKTEILTMINLHDYRRALTALQQYVATFPEDLFMRGLLKKVDAPGAPPK